MLKRHKDAIDIYARDAGNGINGGIITSARLPNGSVWRAEELVGKATRLIPMQSRDDGLASVRFSKSAFENLLKKRMKNETVSQAIERAIEMLPDRR